MNNHISNDAYLFIILTVMSLQHKCYAFATVFSLALIITLALDLVIYINEQKLKELKEGVKINGKS